MKQYHNLVRHVLANGVRKENRTGIDTISTFGYYYEHDLRDGFPLLTTKKISWKNIVVELLWFLSGSNKSEFLERHNCTFWRPWYNNDDTVNAAYNQAWRQFEFPDCDDNGNIFKGSNDQVAWVLNKLKTKPMSRDLVVSAWQPNIAQNPPSPNAYLAPCHSMWILNVQNEELFEHVYGVYPDDSYDWNNYLGFVMALTQEEADIKAREKFGENVFATDAQSSFELKVAKSKRWNPKGSPDGWLSEPVIPASYRKRLCLHLTQRSADVALGIPYNIASYSLLCSLMARFANIEPGIFAHTLVDAHIYTSKADGTQSEYDHISGLQEQLTRKPKRLPKLIIDDSIKLLEDVERLLDKSVTTEDILAKFRLEGYDPYPAIKFKVAV